MVKTNQDNKFKNYIIGSLILAAILIVGIILLSQDRPRELPESLSHDNLEYIAVNTYGSSIDEYFVYIYHPECYYCKELASGSIYQNYIANPKVMMYKISTNNTDPGIADFNPKFEDTFLDEHGIEVTPTLLHIKKTSDNKYYITRIEGVPGIEELLLKNTK